ncbi:hypothetical protein [Ammonifex degensii]|uniref:hypothetical protein n=1 Tax=Ammonifex degensii TaxID=42838 RepID=UPI001FDFC8EC|nr:hypothetical protein [Ammonifex degensii]
MCPVSLRTTLKRTCRKAGVPEIRIRDLRHTHASLLLRQEVHSKVVQERLGTQASRSRWTFIVTCSRHIIMACKSR